VLSDTYILETKLLNYDAAVKNCKDVYGGVIAKVHNTAVNDFLKSLLVSKQVGSAYIGLEAQLPVWKWNDGTPLTNPRWAPNEPNGLREERAELLKSGSWNDINGATTRASFCYIKGVSLFVLAGKTWNEAEAVCESAPTKGWLSKIPNVKTSNEYAAILKTRDQTSAWFGGKQYAKFEKNPSTGWLYLDGTPFTFANWAPNEPNQHQGVEEDCAQLYQNTGKWNDLPCANKLTAFFCDDGTTAGKQAGAPPKNFEFVSITSPTQTVWYNTPMFYIMMGAIMFSIVMFYHRSQNVKKNPLLNYSTEYSSI
jgi:hypothetical protein